MGAINYGTSDYISIGLNVSRDFDEWELENLYNEFSEMLENRRFWYFHITLKPGYYEGFYIDIENNFPVKTVDRFTGESPTAETMGTVKQYDYNYMGGLKNGTI